MTCLYGHETCQVALKPFGKRLSTLIESNQLSAEALEFNLRIALEGKTKLRTCPNCGKDVNWWQLYKSIPTKHRGGPWRKTIKPRASKQKDDEK